MCATTTEARGTGARRLVLATTVAAALLGGCGGGVSIGIGDDDDDPPRVTLSVAPAQAFAGQPVTLLADARDDYAVAYVAFYRVLPDGSAVRLDPLVGGPPYGLTVALPDSITGNVQFFARAVDDANQFRDSNVVVVTLLR
ncbi:hypothetical protein [Azohydromonas aeria]|uniref:hypothetical protein n=1 Tax=Azohydromonas aeria TaxID=2590212 RepID=UPI0012F923F8|nr:hypothetical protein [Azohydromonas aeria]